MPKGRSKELIKARNAKIAQRWYYWTERQRLRFDDALKILSRQEFFLSEERILCILKQYAKEHPSRNLSVKTKVKVPKLTVEQLSLFPEI